MRLVEKEHQLGLVEIARLGQFLEQLRQQPEQEGGVELGRIQQLVGSQDVHHALPVLGLDEVIQVEHGLAEEHVGALRLQRHQPALDGPDRGRRDIAVFGGELPGVVAHVLQHGAQVLGVEQQQPAGVGDAEDQVEHALLGVVELQHARQQQRPHMGDRGAHGMALLPEHIPQGGGAGAPHRLGQAEFGQARLELVGELARLGNAGQVTFDVGHEDRHAQP